jgi:hypothetical protein
MNRFRYIKARLVPLLVVAVLAHFGLGHQDALASVLCIGSDGHVAIENADHNHCAETTRGSFDASGYSTVKTTLNAANECRPCLDIPLAGDDHEPHKPLTGFKVRSPDKATALVRLVIALIAVGKAAIKPEPFPYPLAVDSRLSALRSVVLLI